MRFRKLTAVIAMAGIGLAALTACSSSGGTSASGDNGNASCSAKISYPDAPQVTVWGWYTAEKDVTELFNKNHKDVQICWTNAGQGGDEYTKLRTALQAGSGAPDVAMMEYEQINSFTISKNLVDLSQYGANDNKDKFTAGAWGDVATGDHVYGVPVDNGPVGLYYRKDLFEKAGITTPPTTWDEYAADAAKYQASGAGGEGGVFGNFPLNGQAIIMALFKQAGNDPFDYDPSDPSKIGISINDDASKKVTDYWLNLVKQGSVGDTDAFTTDNSTQLATGKQATYVGAAWGGGILAGLSGQTPGAEWAVAPLPQWDAAKPVQVNWGGSAFTVTSQAKDPKLAAEVAMGMYASDEAVNLDIAAGDVFPTQVSILKSPDFQNQGVKFFNNQTIWKDVFIPAGDAYQGDTFSPFAAYLYPTLQADLVAASKGSQTGDQAMDKLQDELSAYAKQQGFTLK
jgi:ABC-type glycerol-3-phosphate transport system substrate-binding protein